MFYLKKINMKQKLIGMALFFLLGTTELQAQDSTQNLLADSANNSPVGERESGVTISNNDDSTMSRYLPRWEVTSNVTLALSRFSGNVSRNLNDDPYLLMVRKITYNPNNRESAWRLGINGFRRKTEDMNGFSTEVTRSSEENWASLVLGREWRRDLGVGFYAFGGFDGRGIWRNNKSVSSQFDGFGGKTEIVTDAKEYGGSFGGFGGIGFKFHERIIVYTESIVYGQMLQTERAFSVNGVRTSLENKRAFSVVPMVPIALFLTVQF